MLAKRFLYIFLFTLLPLGTTAQQYYRWVDADGVAHFSQHPPEDTSAEQALLPRNAETGPVAIENNNSAADHTSMESTAEATETYADNTYGKDPQLCTQVRQTLTSMTEYSEIRIADPASGQETVLSQEGKVAELERLEHLRAYYCE